MTPTPHSQRCETCEHYELRPEFDECMKCNHPDFKHDVLMHEITGVEFDRIERMGCASHTSAVTLTPALTAHYAALSAQQGKPVSELVARDLEEYQEYRRWLVNEAERL